MSQIIRLFKLNTKEELIAFVNTGKENTGAVNVEYPYIVEWDVDPESGYPYAELYPFLFGSLTGEPVNIPISSLITGLVKPNENIKKLYQQTVEQLVARAEHRVMMERGNNRPAKKRLGK